MDSTNFDSTNASRQTPAEEIVGRRLRELRTRQGYSLRALADRSGLNVNTLSLIENGRTSPSVGTLQQLAQALGVVLVDFFESEPAAKKVVFTPSDHRPQSSFGSTRMQNLAQDLAGSPVQPFVVTLSPGMGSGERMILHSGHEFVYCLAGSVQYRIDREEYTLTIGDSLVFEAHMPHCWENTGEEAAEFILIFYPSDAREEPGARHFSIEALIKEINMKVAVITDDGKTISQHFGRAPYYLVLTIEEGKVTEREMRDKMGHNQFSTEAHAEEVPGVGHGRDAQSHNKHVSMAEVIADCKVLLCGGMGMGAYESMRRLNIQPVVTDLRDVEEAVQAFIDGKLVDHTEMLH